MNDATNGSANESRLRVGYWEVDPNACTIARNAIVTKISPRAMDVLVYLAERPGDTVTHDQLLAEFWRGPASSPNAVHKVITELRRALESDPESAKYIETVPKRGYRLVAKLGGQQFTATRSGLATIISAGSRSALLLASRSDHSLTEYDFIDQVRREIAVRVAQVSGVSTTEVSIETGVHPACDYQLAIDARVIRGQILTSLLITPSSSELPGHAESFESPASNAEVLNATVSQTVSALLVLLDDDHLERMREWGTRNVRAYWYAREGEGFLRIPTPASLARAEERFRSAIQADPRFGHAYHSLAGLFMQLIQDAPDTAFHELQRTKLGALLREAKDARIEGKGLQSVKSAARYASISNAFDAERFWHEELLTDPTNITALYEYGRLLIGAKLFDEGQKYLDRALAQPMPTDWQKNIRSWYGTLAAARGDFEENLRQNNRFLEDMTDSTLGLYGNARTLATLGRFQEAEAYVDRLDATGQSAWAFAARAMVKAIRGDLPKGSVGLDELLNTPTVTNALRGEVCFLVGDTEGGVRAWEHLEPTFRRLNWATGSASEAYYPRSVVNDPRYQASLEKLGIGKTWRAYMRDQVRALAQVTGIEVTTPPPPEDVSTPTS